MQDIASFQGYCSPLHRQLLFWALCVLSGGLLFLASRWFLRVRVVLTLVPCPLAQAEFVLVTVSSRPVTVRAIGVRSHGRGTGLPGCLPSGWTGVASSRWKPALPASPPTPLSQLLDSHQDLVRVHRLASFNSINIQANGTASQHQAHHHVLLDEAHYLLIVRGLTLHHLHLLPLLLIK